MSTTDSKKLSILLRIIYFTVLDFVYRLCFHSMLATAPIENKSIQKNSEIFEGYISDTVDLSVSLTQLKIQKFVFFCDFLKEMLMMKP